MTHALILTTSVVVLFVFGLAGSLLLALCDILWRIVIASHGWMLLWVAFWLLETSGLALMCVVLGLAVPTVLIRDHWRQPRVVS